MAFKNFNPETNSVVNELNKMDTVFHLTGSRYFGDIKPAFNDTDFFCQFTEELYKKLILMGFRNLIGDPITYKDSNLFTTVRIDDPLYGQIEIQLVFDVALKEKAQEKLSKIFIFSSPTKEQWNLAFALLKD